MKVKHLFISRSLEKTSPIKLWCETNNLELTAVSMIAIQYLEFELPETDYYFFSSRNGVRSFFHHVDENQLVNVKFGVVGNATHQELQNYGYQADFVGEGNDTLKIGATFAEFLNDQSVTFCTNNLTLETVSKYVPITQKKNLLVYKTKLQSTKLVQKPDAYIFTSPSNFNAFQQLNELKVSDVIIAIGKSTQQAILTYNSLLKVDIPNEFSEESMLQLLKDLSE